MTWFISFQDCHRSLQAMWSNNQTQIYCLPPLSSPVCASMRLGRTIFGENTKSPCVSPLVTRWQGNAPPITTPTFPPPQETLTSNQANRLQQCQ